MSILISFTNFKGGTTKTSMCRELGFYLALKGNKVLLVDCDSQGNLSKSVLNEDKVYEGLYEAIEGLPYAEQEISENLYILPGDFRLSLLDRRLVGEIDAYTRFKELFNQQEYSLYDFILFDTAPSLNVLTTNALVVSNYFIIPMVTNQYSMQGTNDLMGAVSKIKKTLNPDLSILGVIISSYDMVPLISREIKEEITDCFGDVTFKTVISKSIKFEEAVARKTGVIHLRRLDKSRAKQEVESLGEEFLSRITLRDKKLPVTER